MRWCVAVAFACVLSVGVGAAQPPPEAVLRKEAGNYYLKQRVYEKARDEYLASLRMAPDYADAHYNLGVVYFFRLRDYPRALYHFVRYAQLRPEASDLDQVRELVFQALERIEATEREAYLRALDRGTIEAIETFLQEHPDTVYRPDAERKLEILRRYEEERERWQGEVGAAYQQALARGTPEAMDAFLSRYPDVPQAGEARRLLDLWAKEQAAESEAFQKAVAEGTLAALERFLKAHPQGRYALEAQRRIDHLAAAEKAFRIAKKSRSIPGLEAFLETYGDTPHQAEARQLLEELRAEANRVEQTAPAPAPAADAEETARRAREEVLRAQADQAWAEAEAADTAEAYEAFRAAYPDHPMAEEARRRAAVLRENDGAEAEAAQGVPQATVEEDWRRTRREDTAEAYRAFLKAHPEGEEAEAARKRLEELEARIHEAEKSLPREKRKALERYRKMLEGQ